MKIDQHKFPALFDNDLVISRFKSWLPDEAINIFYDIIKNAKNNMFYITSTIIEYMDQSFTKLQPLKDELPSVCRGILFSPTSGNPHSVMYFVTNSDDKIHIMGQVSAVHGDDHIGDMIAGYFPKGPGPLQFHSYEYVKSMDAITQEIVKIILATELFLNFAEIETREVHPARQIWDGPTCLYNNKTKFPITVVDSSWFTTLVSSGAFKVRGHFRLQPHGEGMAKRKLVWINDFQKDGYTRKAKLAP